MLYPVFRNITTGLVLLAILSPAALSRPGKEPTVSQSGCKRPAVVGVVYKKSFSLAKSAYKKFQTGGLRYNKEPKIMDAFSHMAKDSLIIDYQVCLARRQHGYNRRQAEWLRRMLLFFRSKPNAEQAMVWQKANPFPTRFNRKLFQPCKDKKCRVMFGPEVKDLVTNHTYTILNLVRNRQLKAYDTANGKHQLVLPSGHRVTRYWRIAYQGKFCMSRRDLRHLGFQPPGPGGRFREKGKCFLVVNMGNGVYHLYRNRKHVLIWKNFVKGNKL